MRQVIGLIIAVSAMVRVLQVPIELTSTLEKWPGLPFDMRVVVVGLLSTPNNPSFRERVVGYREMRRFSSKLSRRKCVQ